jgi:AcrR family transcriptional regulator
VAETQHALGRLGLGRVTPESAAARLVSSDGAGGGGTGSVRSRGARSTGSRGERAANTRARVVEAAREVFGEKGFLESTVADIVDRAGVAHGTFYHYFESREDVLREIAEEADQRLNAIMGEMVLHRSPDISPPQRIRDGVRALLNAYTAQAQVMAVLEEASRYNEYIGAQRDTRLRQYIDELAASIRSLQRRGLVDKKLDPLLASAALGCITTRFPEIWLVRGVVDTSLDDATEQSARIFINALGLSD